MTPAQNIVKMMVLTALFGLCMLTGKAQLNYNYTAGKFLIKGQVLDINTHTPISLANLKIKGTGKGLTCDNEGYFTLYVSKTDTLEFSSIGYITKLFSVARFDSSNYYTLQIELIHDFIKLKEVTIYPYKDVDEFKQAFIDKDMNTTFMGIAPPKYSNKPVKSKLSNPISYLYDRLKHRSSANPDFKP
jgi:hypothetical protein